MVLYYLLDCDRVTLKCTIFNSDTMEINKIGRRDLNSIISSGAEFANLESEDVLNHTLIRFMVNTDIHEACHDILVGNRKSKFIGQSANVAISFIDVKPVDFIELCSTGFYNEKRSVFIKYDKVSDEYTKLYVWHENMGHCIQVYKEEVTLFPDITLIVDNLKVADNVLSQRCSNIIGFEGGSNVLTIRLYSHTIKFDKFRTGYYFAGCSSEYFESGIEIGLNAFKRRMIFD